MTFLHVMRQITLLLCRISSIVKSRNFGTLICVLISFWILSFYSRIVQGFSPKLSPKVKLPSPCLLPQSLPQGYWLLPLTFWRACFCHFFDAR